VVAALSPIFVSNAAACDADPSFSPFFRGYLGRILVKMKESARSHVHVLKSGAFVFNQARFPGVPVCIRPDQSFAAVLTTDCIGFGQHDS
jgi:hypothetical protein